jgi:methanol metabolism-related c-type cytochrome
VASIVRAAGVLGLVVPILCGTALAAIRGDASGDPAAASSQDGKYADKDGNPTYKIDGNKVDYYTFAGYIRFTANCMQCHGPDGMGSTYAPSLVNALQTVSYGDFLGIVAGGKRDVSTAQQLVMPALGTDRNVMCYLDAIFVYLRARSDGALGRGRPPEHAPKPDAFTTAENACMG